MMENQQWYLFGPEARVLLLLYKEGEVVRSNIYHKHGLNYKASLSALDYFKKCGVADFKLKGDYRGTQIWYLTPKGKIIAIKLAEVIALIEYDEKDPLKII